MQHSELSCPAAECCWDWPAVPWTPQVSLFCHSFLFCFFEVLLASWKPAAVQGWFFFFFVRLLSAVDFSGRRVAVFASRNNLHEPRRRELLGKSSCCVLVVISRMGCAVRSKGFCFPLLFPGAILPCYWKGCSRVPHLPLPLAWCTELVHWCLGGDEWTKCCMGIDFSELMLQGLTNCLRRSHRPNPSSKSLEIQTNKTKLFML